MSAKFALPRIGSGSPRPAPIAPAMAVVTARAIATFAVGSQSEGRLGGGTEGGTGGVSVGTTRSSGGLARGDEDGDFAGAGSIVPA